MTNLRLNLDMLGEANLHFDANGNPRLWFAECKIILKDRQKRNAYLKAVNGRMDYLREEYVSG